MKTTSKWLALLMALLLIAAACGDGDGSDDTEAPADDTPAATEAPDDTEAPADTEAPMELATDFGVDTEEMTITLGLLSDLTGPFAPLVNAIVEGIRVYWEDVNANGGVNGYMIELEIVDTAYVVDTHVQLYDEMRDDVVAIQHSTGSPHTVAILEQLAEDDMLTIPLTWYSGWSDPNYNANLLSHGTPYCIESMNGIEYVSGEVGAATIAIASIPGDYGLDGAAGAALAAEALGLDVVYNGAGQLIPGDETTYAAVADGIVQSGADMVWMTTTPGVFSATYGQAIAAGFEATWSGNGPTWNPAYVAEGSPIRDAIARDYFVSFYAAPWSDERAADAVALFRQYNADAPDSDYYLEGLVEGKIMHEVLIKAFENNDLTRAGVLAAAKSLETVEVGDFTVSESYVGEPNDRLQRENYLGRVNLEASTGWSADVGPYAAEITKAYEFTGACYDLGG